MYSMDNLLQHYQVSFTRVFAMLMDSGLTGVQLPCIFLGSRRNNIIYFCDIIVFDVIYCILRGFFVIALCSLMLSVIIKYEIRLISCNRTLKMDKEPTKHMLFPNLLKNTITELI